MGIKSDLRFPVGKVEESSKNHKWLVLLSVFWIMILLNFQSLKGLKTNIKYCSPPKLSTCNQLDHEKEKILITYIMLCGSWGSEFYCVFWFMWR